MLGVASMMDGGQEKQEQAGKIFRAWNGLAMGGRRGENIWILSISSSSGTLKKPGSVYKAHQNKDCVV